MNQFILDTVFTKVDLDDGGVAYYASTTDRDGWVVYWPSVDDTLHTYRHPEDWLPVQHKE